MPFLRQENWSDLNSILNINEQIDDTFYAKLLKHIENSS